MTAALLAQNTHFAIPKLKSELSVTPVTSTSLIPNPLIINMAAPAPTSRKREPIQGDEEAGAELKLGEFQDVDALTHSEAALVINALVQKRKMDRKNVNDTE